MQLIKDNRITNVWPEQKCQWLSDQALTCCFRPEMWHAVRSVGWDCITLYIPSGCFLVVSVGNIAVSRVTSASLLDVSRLEPFLFFAHPGARYTVTVRPGVRSVTMCTAQCRLGQNRWGYPVTVWFFKSFPVWNSPNLDLDHAKDHDLYRQVILAPDFCWWNHQNHLESCDVLWVTIFWVHVTNHQIVSPESCWWNIYTYIYIYCIFLYSTPEIDRKVGDLKIRREISSMPSWKHFPIFSGVATIH